LEHRVLALAGSPRRGGNSEKLLDSALAGVAAVVTKLVLNELKFAPCQNCGACNATGDCRFAAGDDMKGIYEALDASDRFVIASPIYFASVSAQLKTMIDRCQAIWARKYLLKRPHANPDRKALFLCCGGFKHDRFYQCARQVIVAWCVVLDIKLSGELFFHSIDARGDIAKHPTALADALNAGRELMK
jgi:putative NADPH-quinone reductase